MPPKKDIQKRKTTEITLDEPDLNLEDSEMPEILDYLADKSGLSEEEHKVETINAWMSKIPLYKRRKLRSIAEKIYTQISGVPTQSDILINNMSFREKCTIIEQLEILNNMMPGSEEFFLKKKEICKIMDDYEKNKETNNMLGLSEHLEQQYIVAQPVPLRTRILRSDISEKNKAVLFEKLKILETFSTNDDSFSKLSEWIEWGMKISDKISPLKVSLTDGSEKINTFLYDVKQYMDSKLFGMINPKERLLELLALRIRNPKANNMSLALCGPPGVGKCLHPDTQVLLFFNGMKAAKNIVRGDILMGDDNQPRIVMSTTSGTDKMFKVIPELGDPFIVNSVHTLTLYNEFTYECIDIPLNEYMVKPNSWKTKYKLFSKPVEYQKQQVKNDPYLVGLLLGSKKKSMDEIIKDYLSKKLDEITYCLQLGNVPSAIEIIDKNEIAYLLNHKHIPEEYLYNSREVRHKLLKGYYEAITFEESKSRSNSRNNFKTIRSLSAPKSNQKISRSISPTPKIQKRSISVSKSRKKTSASGLKIGRIRTSDRRSRLDEFRDRILHKNLRITDPILGEQFKFLIRSLGFGCYQVLTDLIIQTEDINILPDTKTKNQTNFLIEFYEVGQYSGFTIDGNGRFLLSSCVVTHNTELIQTFCEATNQPFAKINMGGSTDSSYYLGHSYTYTGSTPGVLVRALTNLKDSDGNRTRSGVMFFDEFDKIGIQSHVGHVFLHVSDPIQQQSFQDHYMPDISIDLSNLTFVYSMNDKNNIDNVLQNRLPIINLSGYSSQDKKIITNKYIIPKEMKNANISAKELIFTDDAIQEIINISLKDDKDGMRRISQYVQTIINKLGAIICSAGSNKIFSYSFNVELPIKVTQDIINKLNIFDSSTDPQTYLNMFM